MSNSSSALSPSVAGNAPIALESALLRERGFRHAFSTRAVDLRPGRPGYGADLARFASASGLTTARLHQAKQVHGTHVARADRVGAMPPRDRLDEEADAWVAASGRGDVVGVRVADCLPILIGAPNEGGPRAVAAVHAGWRGFVGGVIQAAMRELDQATDCATDCATGGAPRALRVAALGPCIGACCFEVGRDVADQIARAAGDPSVIAHEAGEKCFVDLRRAARLVLIREGLDDALIDDVPKDGTTCTRCDAARFFSYRREADASGRHLAAIAADEVDL